MPIKTFQVVLSIFLLAFLVSCAPSQKSIYNSNFPLTKERVKSVSKEFSLLLPDEWFATEDNENNSFELWLNNKDYSASITFISLIADENSLESENELNQMLKYSEIVKKAELGKNYKQLEYEEYFELNGIPCTAIVFLSKENKIGRIVVFELRGHFYESAATVLNKDQISKKELFEIQNSILNSIY